MYIIIWLIFSIVVGFFASSKGRSGLGYFLLSIIISPLLGFIIVLILSPNEVKLVENGTNKECPNCNELINPYAKICKHCGSSLIEKGRNKELQENYNNKSQTYHFELKNFSQYEFQDIKEKLLEQYGKDKYSNLVIDRDDIWLVKNAKGNSYLEIRIKDELILLVEAYNVDNKPQIFMKNKENDNADKNISNVDKIIELSKLLEKGLITQEEFLNHKKEIG